mmetsp:Transcript_22372/g.55259  ORF Transcript_22372/g.55259 Transcript_22372/m.55259 type:complete len:414 (-) Transcript_22372:6-1247(-)
MFRPLRKMPSNARTASASSSAVHSKNANPFSDTWQVSIALVPEALVCQGTHPAAATLSLMNTASDSCAVSSALTFPTYSRRALRVESRHCTRWRSRPASIIICPPAPPSPNAFRSSCAAAPPEVPSSAYPRPPCVMASRRTAAAASPPAGAIVNPMAFMAPMCVAVPKPCGPRSPGSTDPMLISMCLEVATPNAAICCPSSIIAAVRGGLLPFLCLSLPLSFLSFLSRDLERERRFFLSFPDRLFDRLRFFFRSLDRDRDRDRERLRFFSLLRLLDARFRSPLLSLSFLLPSLSRSLLRLRLRPRRLLRSLSLPPPRSAILSFSFFCDSSSPPLPAPSRASFPASCSIAGFGPSSEFSKNVVAVAPSSGAPPSSPISPRKESACLSLGSSLLSWCTTREGVTARWEVGSLPAL